MKYGYARVSTEKQCLDRQLDMLNDNGVDKIFTEKMTGTKRNRPALNEMLSILCDGDVVIIESLSRLARSTKDLLELIEIIDGKGATLKSLKEEIDCKSATGKLLITLLSAINQFERDITSQRTKEALESKRRRGVKIGKDAIDMELVNKCHDLVADGISVSEACRMVGIGRTTYYKYI